MSITEIYQHLPNDAKKLIRTFACLSELPVPLEGLLKLGLDFPNVNLLLEQLIAVSLLEASYKPHWDVVEYQVAPMVTDWMGKNGLLDANPKWLTI